MITIVSIGAFVKESIELALSRDDTIVHVYEPNKLAYERYPKESDRLFICKEAVTIDGKPIKLSVIKKIVGGYGGTSTYYDGKMPMSGYTLENVVEVPSVRFDSILAQDRIEQLHINCEGEEMNFIKETPVEKFEVCDWIHIGFHSFLEFLNISLWEVNRCVDKLGKIFNSRCSDSRYPNYIFWKDSCTVGNMKLAERIHSTY